MEILINAVFVSTAEMDAVSSPRDPGVKEAPSTHEFPGNPGELGYPSVLKVQVPPESKVDPEAPVALEKG